MRFDVTNAIGQVGKYTVAEVAQLYQQHTDDTGQIFTTQAIETAFDLTQGQPWLVNALAKDANLHDKNYLFHNEQIRPIDESSLWLWILPL